MEIKDARRVLPSIAAMCVLFFSSFQAFAADPALAVVPDNPRTPPPEIVKLAEGTEIHLHLADKLSSATSSEGDTFQVISDDAIPLPNGTLISAGYSGKGEVTKVEKAGMLGRGGQLGIRLTYLKGGDNRIKLRANKSNEGKSGVTNVVVTTVLFGPLGLLIHGHSIVYEKGQPLTAYVDEDTMISTPPPPPPEVE